MAENEKKVILACTVCSNRNYRSDKNTTNQSERLEIRKFCRECGAHTLHRETK
ncbi:50S ribosomal protein L33 [Thalassobacillus sp. CUG 92003]|uniref:50S ribosomal protein L33 n=1 Tax=Thalassobacillus sp. CUG 92003 TaxID=2736641 RepID=UPI0015E62E34